MTDAPLPPNFGTAPGPTLLRAWEASGLLCALGLNPVLGHYLGYVLAPGITGEEAERITVHGGVTFGPEDGWVGWDSGHGGDHIPGLGINPDGRHWTQAEAEAETEWLAAAAASLRPPSPVARPRRGGGVR